MIAAVRDPRSMAQIDWNGDKDGEIIVIKLDVGEKEDYANVSILSSLASSV